MKESKFPRHDITPQDIMDAMEIGVGMWNDKGIGEGLEILLHTANWLSDMRTVILEDEEGKFPEYDDDMYEEEVEGLIKAIRYLAYYDGGTR